VRRNEKILDGECNSVRRFESKVGAWKYWCYVDPEEDCEDTKDGSSFRACSGGNAIPGFHQQKTSTNSGCPNSHVVHNQTSETDMDILTDVCRDEDSNEWLAPEEAVDDEAEIIIDMGCLKKLKGLQMKNIQRDHGGTKQFTIFLSEFHDGPWESVLTEELPEQVTDGCGLMQTFNLK
jgi:hypothetical protein